VSNDINVKIKKLSDNAVIPQQATVGSAGFDLHVVLPFDKDENEQLSKIVLNPNERVRLNTGLAFQLPENHVMLIAPRSSMGIKKNLRLQNTLGVLDADYTGECFLFVENTGNEKIEILHKERIAQAIVLPYPKVSFETVDELAETSRGEGGMGSTGKV